MSRNVVVCLGIGSFLLFLSWLVTPTLELWNADPRAYVDRSVANAIYFVFGSTVRCRVYLFAGGGWPEGRDMTHGIERTSPMGESFVGRCVYCGRTGLAMADALKPCEKAPSQDQQVLDAIGRPKDATE